MYTHKTFNTLTIPKVGRPKSEILTQLKYAIEKKENLEAEVNKLEKAKVDLKKVNADIENLMEEYRR